MAIKIETPPALKGLPEQQILQMYSFLFRLSENLNIALNNLTEDNFSSTAAYSEVIGGSGQDNSKSQAEALSNSYNELRALITNTANIVNANIDILRNEYESEYTAISDAWGTFQENISSTIETTAQSVVQSYNYDAAIQALNEAAAGFSEYQISTEGYIRSGFIDYDDNNVPILGIAIGQGLKSTTVTIDGEEYEQIDSTQSCAFYTANKVSFRINGQEVAYISNRKLYIGDVEINGDIMLRNDWFIGTSNGISVKWIGGAI